MGFGPTPIGAMTAMVPCLPMFFSTWETYHTHTLYLGYFNGPTEGLILACSIMLLSGYFGPHIWSEPFAELFPLPAVLQQYGAYTARDIWAYIVLGSFFAAHLPSCVMNVAEARRKQGLPLLPVFLEWTPMIVYSAACCAWLGSPHSIALRDNHLMLFCLTQSFVFGRLTTKVILAHLTKQAYPYWTILMTPLVLGAVLVQLPTFGLPAVLDAQSELYFLYGYFVFAMVVYFRWAFLVISSICRYLGIQCLTIPEEKYAAAKREQEVQKAAAGKTH